MTREDFLQLAEPYSLCSKIRIQNVFDELEWIRVNGIDGDIAECGVYKGGLSLAILEYLRFHDEKRGLWLYDTFSGMTQPSAIDEDLNGNMAEDIFSKIRCYCSLGDVQKLLARSPNPNVKYIVGDVAQTLTVKTNLPTLIALLRLDTDFYDSTRAELTYLYPRLHSRGVLIIDDYGHWKGARAAVDEYFKGKPEVLLNKIDYTALRVSRES